MAWAPSATVVDGNSISAAYWNSTVGLANSPVVAKAIATGAQAFSTAVQTQVAFNSTGTAPGFANGPTLSGGNLVVNTAGIYQVTSTIEVSFSGTLTAYSYQIYASVGGTLYLIGSDTMAGVALTGAITCSTSGMANLAATDWVYATITIYGATSPSVNATSSGATGSATNISALMVGVL